jgi:filamentous hemagglutinin family protein
VGAGSATIATPSAGRMNIIQSTDKAVINWQGFSIGSGQWVDFQQPSATSATLNRVTGNTSSNIAGKITANGQIMLLNPNGILFGPTAQVDVAGLTASTLNVTNADFMAGGQDNLNTLAGKAAATVENQGIINITDGGYAALVAPGVANSGAINARLGKVVLASGTRAALDFRGDGLVSLAVEPSKEVGFSPLVSNTGSITADGGVVTLSARAGATVVNNVINTTGLIQANSANAQNGRIVLSGGNAGIVALDGTITATGSANVTGNNINAATSITTPTATFTALKDINFSGNYATGGGNLSLVTAGGKVDTQGVTTSGGTINITSAGAINTLNLDSTSGALNGGAISLLATNGNITTGSIDTSSTSTSGNASDGGGISLTARGSSGGSITVNGDVNSTSSGAGVTPGTGGAVNISAANTLNLNSINNIASSNTGYGNITLTGNEINLNGGANSIRGDGKEVLLQSSSLGQKVGIGASDTGATDTLDLTTTDLAALKDGFSRIYLGRTFGRGAVSIADVTFLDPVGIRALGSGGTITANGAITGASGSDSSITLQADGAISTQGIRTYGNGINLRSFNGGITTNGANLDSTNGALNGGGINLVAGNGNISTGNINSYSVAASGNTGSGGAIALSAREGNITTGDLNSYSHANTGNAGQAGAIIVLAATDRSESAGHININGTVLADAQGQNRALSGGNLTFNAVETLTLGSVNNSSPFNSSKYGNVSLLARQINLNPGATTIIGNTITTTGSMTAADAANSSILLQANGNISIGDYIKTYGNAINIHSLNGGIATNGEASIDSTNGALNGGAITIAADNGSIITDAINSSSIAYSGAAGNGGAINLTAGNGSITAYYIDSGSYAYSGDTGDGGAINLTATNGNIINPLEMLSVSSATGTAGDGGAINLTATNGITTGALHSYSSTGSGTAGNGGVLSLNATNGNIQILYVLDSYSFTDSGTAGNGGNITLNATNGITINANRDINSYSSATTGTAGNGGTVNLTATNGGIQAGGIASYSSASDAAGSGGVVNLTATNDNLTTGSITSYSSAGSSTAGDGGAINLTATNGGIETGNLESGALSGSNGNAGNGGDITVNATNGISTNGIASYSIAGSGTSGNAGTIFLNATNGSIQVSNLNSTALSGSNGNAGNGGDITMNATNGITTNGNDITSYSYATGGTTGNGGAVNFTTTNGNITTNGIGSYSYAGGGAAGDGGAISLNATNGSIETAYLQSISLSGPNGNGGNGGAISLSAGTDATIGELNSYSTAGSGTAGNGGAINLSVGNIITLKGNINTYGGTGSGNLSFSSNQILLTQDLTFNTDGGLGTDGSVSFGVSKLASDVANTGRTLSIYKGSGTVNPNNSPAKTADVTVIIQ